jgi:hypothetical protein
MNREENWWNRRVLNPAKGRNPMNNPDDLIKSVQLDLERNAKQLVTAWLAKEKEDIRRELASSYRALADDLRDQLSIASRELYEKEKAFTRLRAQYQAIREFLVERDLEAEYQVYEAERNENV